MKSWAAVAGAQKLPQQHSGVSTERLAAGSGELQRGGTQDPLLREAVKSRADVTGVRRCLACGRAFNDLQRFCQHLKDAHWGHNSVLPPPGSAPGGSSSSRGGGDAAAAPSLRAAVQLGDVLLRSMAASRSGAQKLNKGQHPQKMAAPPQQQRRQVPEQKRAWGHLGPAAGQQMAPAAARPAAYPAAATSSSVAAGTALPTPPPGTRRPRKHKRESRLKRAFRRSQAVQACGRWQGVLAELEAALQAVGEAQGCLTNQLAAMQLQLAQRAPADAARSEGIEGAAGVADTCAVSGGSFELIPDANPAAGLGEDVWQRQERQVLQANLMVLCQVLGQHLLHASECREKLDRAHQQARGQLAKAQRELQKLEGLPADEEAPPTSAAAGGLLVGGTNGSSSLQQAATVAVEAVEQPQAGQAAAGEAAAIRQQGLVQPCTQGSAPPAASAGSASGRAELGGAREGTVAGQAQAQAQEQLLPVGYGEDGAASEASGSLTSSMGSFAFQDVLSGWAASNRQLGSRQTAAVAAAPRSTAAAVGQRAAASGGDGGGSARAVDTAAAKLLASQAGAQAARQPSTTAAASAVPKPSAPPETSAAAAPQAAAPAAGAAIPAAMVSSGTTGAQAGGISVPREVGDCGDDGSRNSSSSSSSSSSGSFCLQWGNQLLSWASNIRVDAAAVALHAFQPPQAPPAALAPLQAQQAVPQQPALPAQQPASAPADPPLAGSQHPVVRVGASQQRPAATSATAGVDVAAWLSSSSSSEARDGLEAGAVVHTTNQALQTAGAALLPLPKEGSGEGSLRGSIAAASAGAAAAGPAVTSALAAAAAAWSLHAAPLLQAQYVQPAQDVPGAFCCLLCQITVSGERNLQEHLGSKRHVRRVAAQAATAAADAVGGAETQQGLGQAAVAEAAGGGQGRGGGAGGRTYTGHGADVEPYVNQVITSELNCLAELILRRLLEWQERTRLTDPLNFKRKRRVVSGMREVEKCIKTRKAKVVFLAPNISSIVATGDDAAAAAAAAAAGKEEEEGAEAGKAGASDGGDIQAAAGAAGVAPKGECPASLLVALAALKEVPLVFALSRQRMGKLMGQRKRASAFAILDANGVFEELRRLLVLAEEGRHAWQAQQ